MDYVDDIIAPGKETGLKISDRPRSNIRVNYISCENLNYIIDRLRRFG